MRALRDRLRGERGFTLVELLVVMLSGTVIVLATFSLIDITLRQTTRSTDRVDASQRGRVWLEQLVQEMNSGCVAPDVSPLQAIDVTGTVHSDASDVVFITGQGSGSSTTGYLYEHVVSYSSTAHTLTDTAYKVTGGSAATSGTAATWTISSSASWHRTLSNVTAAGFSYYSYAFPTNNPTNSLAAPVAVPVPLSTSWPANVTVTSVPAPAVARVDISFTVGPTDGSTDAYRLSNLSDSVVFRLTPPSSTSTNVPCD